MLLYGNASILSLVPFCGRIDRRVAGAEAASSMAATFADMSGH